MTMSHAQTDEQRREETLRLALAEANLPHGSEPRFVAAALRALAGNLAFDAAAKGSDRLWALSDLAEQMAREIELKLPTNEPVRPAFPLPAGWSATRSTDRGDDVITISRGPWVVRVSGSFDEFLGATEVRETVLFRGASIIGCTDLGTLSAAAQDSDFRAALEIASRVSDWLNSELEGDIEPATLPAEAA